RKALLKAGEAGIEEHVTLMLHYASIQQWTKAREHLTVIEKRTDKPAKRWLRDAILHLSRRNDELLQRHREEAGQLAESKLPANAASFLAQFLYSRTSQYMHPAEMLPLLDKLEPVHRRQPERLHAMRDWTRKRAAGLANLGRIAESRELMKNLATQYPRD